MYYYSFLPWKFCREEIKYKVFAISGESENETFISEATEGCNSFQWLLYYGSSKQLLFKLNRCV